MTMPDESVRSLQQIRYWLYQLAAPGPMSKKKIREIIRAALRHYPHTSMLRRMLKKEFAQYIKEEKDTL